MATKRANTPVKIPMLNEDNFGHWKGSSTSTNAALYGDDPVVDERATRKVAAEIVRSHSKEGKTWDDTDSDEEEEHVNYALMANDVSSPEPIVLLKMHDDVLIRSLRSFIRDQKKSYLNRIMN